LQLSILSFLLSFGLIGYLHEVNLATPSSNDKLLDCLRLFDPY